eukprot:tig00021036_g17402.t1
MGLVLVNIFIAILSKNYDEAGAEAVKLQEELEELLSPEDHLSPFTKIVQARLQIKKLHRDAKLLPRPGPGDDKRSRFRLWLSEAYCEQKDRDTLARKALNAAR